MHHYLSMAATILMTDIRIRRRRRNAVRVMGLGMWGWRVENKTL